MGRNSAGLTRVAAYGKLPISREFLEFRCDSVQARALIDLLHEAARTLADLAPRPDAIRLCLPIEPGRSYVVASIWPSADEGGQRRFPFCIFTICNPDELPPHPGMSTAMAPTHEYHEQVYARLGSASSTSAFEHCLDEEGEPPPFLSNAAEVFGARSRSYPTTRWAAALYDRDPHRFLMSLWRLKHVCDAGDDIRQYSGVRLPLVRSHALETQSDAWLGVLARHGLVNSEPRSLCGRFGPEKTGSMVVFFRGMQPADFEIVVERSVEGLIDLTKHKEVADQGGFDRFQALVQARLAKSCNTLATFSDILGNQ